MGAGVDASKRLLLAEATGAILTDVASSLAAEAQGASADRDDAMNASWTRDAVLFESLVEGGPKAILDIGGNVCEDVIDVRAMLVSKSEPKPNPGASGYLAGVALLRA